MIRKGEKHGSLKLLNFYNNFSGSTANSASLSNRAPSSSASDDFPLSSAFMSRDSGIHLCLSSISSIKNYCSKIVSYQMVSECEDEGGYIRGVPAVGAGHVLLPHQEPLLHQILQRQQLSLRPRGCHRAPRQWDGIG